MKLMEIVTSEVSVPERARLGSGLYIVQASKGEWHTSFFHIKRLFDGEEPLAYCRVTRHQGSSSEIVREDWSFWLPNTGVGSVIWKHQAPINNFAAFKAWVLEQCKSKRLDEIG